MMIYGPNYGVLRTYLDDICSYFMVYFSGSRGYFRHYLVAISMIIGCILVVLDPIIEAIFMVCGPILCCILDILEAIFMIPGPIIEAIFMVLLGI